MLCRGGWGRVIDLHNQGHLLYSRSRRHLEHLKCNTHGGRSVIWTHLCLFSHLAHIDFILTSSCNHWSSSRV